jgi:hypothetical protein
MAFEIRGLLCGSPGCVIAVPADQTLFFKKLEKKS